MMRQINWGIIGLGNIADEFAQAFKEVSNANLLAVASRDKSKLKKFSQKFNISEKYNFLNYNEIINCSEIDIIYIALPHSLHYQWIVKCIEAKKNVICEKPATINLIEIQKINNLLDKNEIFFAEGFMYRFHPQTIELIKIIKSNKIGKIYKMESYFGQNIVYKKNFFGIKKFKINVNNRLFNKQLGGGAILDLGCYPASLSILINKLLKNSEKDQLKLLNKRIDKCNTEVDLDSYVDLKFSNDFTSSIGCSFTKDLGQPTTIYGNNGEIKVPNTWRCSQPSIIVNNKEHKFENLKYKNIFSYQIDSVSKSIVEKNFEPSFPGINRQETESNLEILDKWMI